MKAALPGASEGFDEVQKARHYNSHTSGVEAIEIVRYMSFNMGNAMKYCWRAGVKDAEKSLQDLEKALYYLRDEQKHRTFNLEYSRLLSNCSQLIAKVEDGGCAAGNIARARVLRTLYTCAVRGTEYNFEVAIEAIEKLKISIMEGLCLI